MCSIFVFLKQIENIHKEDGLNCCLLIQVELFFKDSEFASKLKDAFQICEVKETFHEFALL